MSVSVRPQRALMASAMGAAVCEQGGHSPGLNGAVAAGREQCRAICGEVKRGDALLVAVQDRHQSGGCDVPDVHRAAPRPGRQEGSIWREFSIKDGLSWCGEGQGQLAAGVEDGHLRWADRGHPLRRVHRHLVHAGVVEDALDWLVLLGSDSPDVAVQVGDDGESAIGRGGDVEQDGVALRMIWRRMESLSPTNGGLPVSSSYRVTPRLQTSVRTSTGFPAACSGLM